jgi:stage II sporulation protein M
MRFRISIVIVIVLFALGLVWGLLSSRSGVSSVPATGSIPGTGSAAPGTTLIPDTNPLSSQIKGLENLAKFITDLPAWAMFLVIMLKNMSAVLFSFLASPVFLIFPVFSLVINGWVIGVVSNQVLIDHSIGYLLKALLPHGIIEIPALFIGEAAAIVFGIAIMQAIVSRKKRELLPASLKLSVKGLIISLILLVPAALMETFVTPALLR